MPRTTAELRRHALRIWQAGVDAVRSERLVHGALRMEGTALVAGQQRIELSADGRIVVVGAGKAGAGMALAVEQVLGPQGLQRHRVTGWVNVPEDCVCPTQCIRLHAARPPGINEPTPAGAAGAAEILRLVGALGPDDLCLALISGGGSALMPAPADGITLTAKLALTRFLSAAGANIEQLNTVRKQLSRIKGGGLARACRAGTLLTLIISDVLGDPLEVIASGPTVPDSSPPQAALAILDQFQIPDDLAPGVRNYLRSREGDSPVFVERKLGQSPERKLGQSPSCRVLNLVIGNNAMAVDAAGREAERLGYCPAMISATRSEGPAEDVGRHLAGMALQMRGPGGQQSTDCLISGGEPVVTLVGAARRGLGGRNQQLVLAALEQLAPDGAAGIALLSGGTDGEDGPTDAAGAVLDASVVRAAQQHGLDPAEYLARNDAYHFFEPLGALLKTGPTHTNVCDLRVVVVDRER